MSQLQHLLPPNWKKHIQNWLDEDIPSFDVGGYVVGDENAKATLLLKSSGVLAGVPFFDAIFEAVGCTVKWHYLEGQEIALAKEKQEKLVVAEVSGQTRNILLGERTALNMITRASGIATEAKNAVALASELKWHGHVAGTRKTTPGFRLVEKYSLLVGKASTHRYDLSQMVMLKDNHIKATGDITKAVAKAKGCAGFSTKIEVECRNFDEALEAAKAGADIVMLDNFSSDNLKKCAKKLKETFPSLIIEASGGITYESLSKYLCPWIDIVSLGCLTQGYSCLDFSLKIVSEKKKTRTSSGDHSEFVSPQEKSHDFQTKPSLAQKEKPNCSNDDKDVQIMESIEKLAEMEKSSSDDARVKKKTKVSLCTRKDK